MIVSTGAEAPAAITPAVVQVTAWPAAEQLQPAPPPLTYVSPAGSVSTTVTTPVVERVPVPLLAVSE